MSKNLRAFLAGCAVFALAGWIPGPQGAASGGGASFTGDLAGNTLTDGTNGYVLVDVPIQGGVYDSYTTPEYTFSADPDTGWCLSGVGTQAWTVAGTAEMTLNGSALVLLGNQIRTTNGSAGTPIYSFTSSNTTGIYSSGTSTFDIATAGVNALSISSSQNATFAGTVSLGGSDAGLQRLAAGVLGVYDPLAGAASSGLRFQNASGTGTVYASYIGASTLAIGSNVNDDNGTLRVNKIVFDGVSNDLEVVSEGVMRLDNGVGTTVASSLRCYNAGETDYTEFGGGTYQVSGPTGDGLRLRAQSGQYWYAIIGTTAELTINPTSHNVEMYDTGNLVLKGPAATSAYLSANTTGVVYLGQTDDARNGRLETGTLRALGSDGSGDYSSLDHDGTSTVLTDNGTTFLSGNGSNTTVHGILTNSSGRMNIDSANEVIGYNSQVQVASNTLSGISDNTATTILTVGLPSSLTACGGTITVTVRATDGTDMQTATDVIQFTALNKAGTLTVNARLTDTDSGSGGAVAVSTGSWTSRGYAATASGTNVLIQGTWDSSLTVSSMVATYQVVLNADPAVASITLP